MDETYVKVSGVWRYVYRAVDQFGQIIDVYLSTRRDAAAARCFVARALSTTKVSPAEVVTDKAAVYPRVLDELVPGAWHHNEQYANNRIEADHGQLKRRLRPMRGLKASRGAMVVITGHAFTPEHPPRALRTRHPAASDPAARGSLQRAGPGDLTKQGPRKGTNSPSYLKFT